MKPKLTRKNIIKRTIAWFVAIASTITLALTLLLGIFPSHWATPQDSLNANIVKNYGDDSHYTLYKNLKENKLILESVKLENETIVLKADEKKDLDIYNYLKKIRVLNYNKSFSLNLTNGKNNFEMHLEIQEWTYYNYWWINQPNQLLNYIV